VILVETGGERWLVSPYGLVGSVHNVRATPELSLRRGKRSEQLWAEEVDAATAGPVLQRYVRNARATAPFFDANPVTRSRSSWQKPDGILCSGVTPAASVR
jgi:hypothetical protein